MNKFKLFPLALAAFAFSACTSEDAVENNPNVEGVKSYVAVNINNVGAGGTRADGATYENGTAAESKINTIRFYFFTQDGKPFKMADGTNFKEVNNPTGTDKADGGNVEHITDAVIVIDGINQTYPQTMMAVVNPATLADNQLTNFMTRDDVAAVVAKQNFKNQSATASDFVMTSSVYAKGTDVCWTSDISGHVALSETAAKDNPVDIYVERVAAKITSTANGATAELFPVSVGETATGTKIFAKIMGWGIARENTEANLIKKIEPDTWTNIGFNWNDADFMRSYWETTPEAFGEYKSWDAYTSTKLGDVYYTAPNTSVAKTDRPVYVAAAQLVDADGHILEIAKYKGVEYLGEDVVKNVILNENKNYFKKIVTSAGTTTKGLEASDIEFVVDATKSYQVKAKLVDGVVVYKNVNGIDEDATAEANTSIGKENATIYKNGMTYYWTSVKHLGAIDSEAELGMVRNHFYKVDVTSIKGLGTAVYNPYNKFEPVNPDDDPHTYLAARINVLSWRVVGQTVELGK